MSNANNTLTVSLGAVLASIASFTVNHSIVWALVHGLGCGWFYCVYWVFKYSGWV